MGASIRRERAASANARSFCKAVMRERLMPSAGFSVYCVTEGPTFTSDISTSMPKFCRVRLMILAFALMSPDDGVPLSPSRRSSGGGIYDICFWGSRRAGFGFDEKTFEKSILERERRRPLLGWGGVGGGPPSQTPPKGG